MPLPPMAAARQGLVSVAGISGYWSRCTVPAKAAAATKMFDGGSQVPEILLGNAEVDDATVERPFRPGRDAALLPALLSQVNNLYTSVTVQYADANLVPVGAPLLMTGWLRSVTAPAVDSGSGEAQMLTLVFAVDNLA